MAWARLGPDSATIEVRFRDGATVAVLPRTIDQRSLRSAFALRPHRMHVQAGPAGGRAIVLEPFAHELLLGSTPGKPEADALTQSGFRVDVVVDGNVTVGVMETLADYSMVYIQTHSGVLPDGDAIVATGESDATPYASLYEDHSLLQALVAGDPAGTLYNAITATFVTKHVGMFPDSSIVFLNGCSLLRAPVFWNALQKQNVGTMISWDHEVYSMVSEPAAEFILTDLAKGDSVETDIAAAYAAGLGTSIVADEVAKLGFLGDGNDTLPRALAGASPTSTPQPTATATSTPTPSPTPVRATKCKRGQHRIHGKCRPRHSRCKGPRCKKRL